MDIKEYETTEDWKRRLEILQLSTEELDMWLDSPHMLLSFKTPRECFQEGKGDKVRALLENTYAGNPL